MLLIVLYLGTKYDVCECNSLQDMTISSFLWPLIFACDLHRPSRSLSFLSLDQMLCFYVLVPSMKFVGSIEFEIWPFVWRKLKWWIMTSSPIWLLWNLNTNRPSDIPNFILIKHKRAEKQGREVNRELWRKNGYYVTMTFDLRSQISIGFEPML